MIDYQLLQGACRLILPTLPDNSVHCAVTSPPYFNLRDYQTDGQIGQEQTPEQYVAGMTAVFREVRRVLHPSGVAFLNLGDSYANDTKWRGSTGGEHARGLHGNSGIGRRRTQTGLGPKNLIGIPWRVAFALQADGWCLRQDIIWSKPSPLPESVEDRCTRSHEYLFLLTKNKRYYFDTVAIAEPAIGGGTRNRRTVWTITPAHFPEAHFATYPAELIKPCILAGTSAKGCCPQCLAPYRRTTEKVKGSSASSRGSSFAKGKTREAREHLAPVSEKERTVAVVTIGWQPTCKCNAGDPIPCTVLDMFNGAGTTGVVSLTLGRRYIGIELNPDYLEITRRRLTGVQPMLLPD